MKYYITNDGSFTNIKQLSDSSIKQALRLRHSKVGIGNLENIIHTRYCAFCGRVNNTWYFTYTISGTSITITGIEYKKPLFYCFNQKNTDCKGKVMNPNSVEMVSKIYGVDNDEALKIIHNRNSTPFYNKNHESEHAYKDYQSHKNLGEDEKRKSTEKANHSRSLVGYIERFGADGERLWKESQAKKAITLESMTLRYGTEEGKRRFEQWLKDVSPTVDNYIKWYGNDGLDLLRKRIDSALVTKSGHHFSKVTIEDGNVLRSNLERKVYRRLKDLGVPTIITDGYYPNDICRYDIMLPEIGMYIEVCGMRKSNKKYWINIQNKIDKYAPLVLERKDIEDDAKLNAVMQHIADLYKLKNIELKYED